MGWSLHWVPLMLGANICEYKDPYLRYNAVTMSVIIIQLLSVIVDDNPESNNIVKKLVDIVENMGKRLVNIENRNDNWHKKWNKIETKIRTQKKDIQTWRHKQIQILKAKNIFYLFCNLRIFVLTEGHVPVNFVTTISLVINLSLSLSLSLMDTKKSS